MTKTPKTLKKPEIADEPGAEQRFTNILKRALNTPPKRRHKTAKRRSKKDEGQG